ncbi:alpha/beta hydrolase-fold protein [Pontimicrobium aquaticum]|uniref:Esterase n=1 Tax=Pontimicrobium aquaticum TaxID=2565367 RepID=A0A4U0EQN9_9FLAO|nr:alpha/beta hydrolase-fold protein [Pontimicrobium aquaticum]TJY33454.1 esterase [Pontimicrobium aquaticum]
MRTFLKLIIFVLCYSSVNGQQSNSVQPIRIIDSLYSNTLNETREFWVSLPENCNPNSNETYPVVYLLDGFSLENTLKTVYDNYLGHYLPHMILVGISNKENRTRDLTISKIEERRGSTMNVETGGADNFRQFIENELIPHIDKTYPTTNYKTLIGHSYAGLFTLDMLINSGDVFKNYIAIDPSIEWDNQKLLKQAQEKLKTHNYKGKSLYVSLAAEQLHMWDEKITIDNVMDDTSGFTLFARSIIEFSNLASSQKQNELNFSWKIYPEDLHGTVPLPSIRDGLIFCFKWFQFQSPQKYNNPETTVQELQELLKQQEVIYTNQFGYSVPPMIEELFIGYGYMNMQMEQPEKALLFFELAIKYYPDSANAYDAMADYYASQQDYANALKCVTKAYNINADNYYKQRIEEFKVKSN